MITCLHGGGPGHLIYDVWCMFLWASPFLAGAWAWFGFKVPRRPKHPCHDPKCKRDR